MDYLLGPDLYSHAHGARFGTSLTCQMLQAKERLDLDNNELNAKQELLQQKADSYKPLLSSAGPVCTPLTVKDMSKKYPVIV